MEELFWEISGYLALGVEAIAVLVIVIGALQAVVRIVSPGFISNTALSGRREVWLHFAAWLLLGLEFELAADVIRTAIIPTWTALGQLAAIAVIRTFLNFFLGKDIERAAHRRRPAEA
jgi:uncharacterized membrane protein